MSPAPEAVTPGCGATPGMEPTSRLERAHRWLRGGAARHGLQLAAAVVASYLVSFACGLPEGFWAVMSALIVVRPDAGATLGAGWDRVRGTLLGTACGLLGVWLRHLGAGTPAEASAIVLAIVALLAFASAGVPILRSAPITALIILSSGGIAGHSALQVAGLRVAEIAIGVAIGLTVSVAVPAARAAARFHAECAALLRRLAAQVEHTLERGQAEGAKNDAALNDAREAATKAMRADLRRLVLLGESADRESRWSLQRGRLRSDTPARHRRIAQLMTRTVQDAGLLGRVFDALPTHRGDACWPALAAAAGAALRSSAGAMAGGAPAELAALAAFADGLRAAPRSGASHDEPATLLPGPLRLLNDDLRALDRLARASAAR